MRRIFTSSVLFVVLFGLLSVAFAQDTIKPEETGKYIGQQKTVCGTVASAHYATRSKGQPTFINLNKPYPNQVFTVLIWGSDRGKFEKPPEMLYSGKEICVTGMIKSYQGRPEIIVKDPSQIKAK
jgi:DNA/RNA endonuclease YhcR with UshA esterase domain